MALPHYCTECPNFGYPIKEEVRLFYRISKIPKSAQGLGGAHRSETYNLNGALPNPGADFRFLGITAKRRSDASIGYPKSKNLSKG